MNSKLKTAGKVAAAAGVIAPSFRKLMTDEDFFAALKEMRASTKMSTKKLKRARRRGLMAGSVFGLAVGVAAGVALARAFGETRI